MKKSIAAILCSLPLAWASMVHAEGGDTVKPDMQGSPATSPGDAPVPGTDRDTRHDGSASDRMDRQHPADRMPDATGRRDSTSGPMDSPADRNPNPASPTDREGLESNSTSTDTPPNIPRTAQ
ncbi:hypothetical protein [Pusillimonas sp.]|uniref:hypothetical protein n=1 Tax=Pusillimonas sp. TaxID=3040095 RepID=UPI0029ADFD3C|nr:hypothetical protein [Pusillimonas sp.]MDX3893520.1 hypothetical protein [Pusillimonas sp.]